MGRTIAIVGASPSRFDIVTKPERDKEGNLTVPGERLLSPEVELWTINRMVCDGNFQAKDVQRIIEIHFPWFVMADWYDYGPDYRDWLKKEQPFPIYMQEQYEQVPSSVEYPLEGVLDVCFRGITRGGKPVKYMTSTFSYAVALGIYEHVHPSDGMEPVDRMELYGFEMPHESEWYYQRPGALYMIGVARGMDMEVEIPDSVYMYDTPLYGYEVADMIPRQTFEEYKVVYHREFEEGKARLNHAEGKAQTLMAAIEDMKPEIAEERKQRLNGNEPDEDYEKGPIEIRHDKQMGEFEVVQEEWRQSFANMHRADAAIQVMDKMILKCDLQEVPPELKTRVGRLDMTKPPIYEEDGTQKKD